ncbi:MAG: diguanylate cyclase [Burkholderiales bacterium]|nr:diguanylate cyclase [Burkholderiales bacterium]
MQHYRYLVSLLLLLVAGVLGSLLYAGQQSHDRAMLQGATHAVNLAKVLQEQLRSAFQSADFLLDDVASHIDPKRGLPDVDSEAGQNLRHLLFDKWRRSPSLADIGFLDAQGRTRYVMVGDGETSQIDESLLQALRTDPHRDVVFSAPQRLPQLREPGVMIVRAIRDDTGRPIAFAVGWLRSQYFASLFSPLDLGTHGVVWLQDEQRRLVVRQPAAVDFPVGTQYSMPVLEAGPVPQTFIQTSQVDGMSRVSARLPVADYPFTLVVGIAENDALMEWRTQSTRYFIAGVLVVLLAAALIIVMLNAARQAEALAETAALLQQGEARQRQLMEFAPTAMAQVSGTPPMIVFANRDFETLFSCEHGAGVGRLLTELFGDPADATRLLEDAATSGELHERELRLTDGRDRFWGQVSVAALPGAGRGNFLISFANIDARKKLENRLTTEASTDALTGLANRRHFFARSEGFCELARRYRRPLAVALLDLDWFKHVNDTFGHSIGDAVLERTARILQVTLRQPDLPARIGGEEFVALLPETTLDQAIEAAERIRQAIEDAPLTLEDGRLVAVTASLGVAIYENDEPNIQAALDRADAALYRAKQAGRNRVEYYQQPEPSH